MRIKKDDLRRDLSKATLEAFNSALKIAQKNNEVDKMMNNLLTESEKLMLGRRLLAGRLLLQGRTQIEVRSNLRISPNTIQKIRQWVQKEIKDYDSKAVIISPQGKKNTNVIKSRRDLGDPMTFYGFRQRYSTHFLLFNLAEELIDKLLSSKRS